MAISLIKYLDNYMHLWRFFVFFVKAPYKFYKTGETKSNPFTLSINLIKTLHYRFATAKNEYHVDIK
ncbi:hypothetical protein A9P82_05700 [Arachidicoccus ginsenosidimutans]|nr:hypothetical protein A9P82_05700 [Arachidicoccus sp. BS20]